MTKNLYHNHHKSFHSLIDGWYEIDPKIRQEISGKQLSLNFINALSIGKALIYGEDKFQYFWHGEPHYKEYAELIKETLNCDFEFLFLFANNLVDR